jgi:hypothetical protein
MAGVMFSLGTALYMVSALLLLWSPANNKPVHVTMTKRVKSVLLILIVSSKKIDEVVEVVCSGFFHQVGVKVPSRLAARFRRGQTPLSAIICLAQDEQSARPKSQERAKRCFLYHLLSGKKTIGCLR